MGFKRWNEINTRMGKEKSIENCTRCCGKNSREGHEARKKGETVRVRQGEKLQKGAGRGESEGKDSSD